MYYPCVATQITSKYEYLIGPFHAGLHWRYFWPLGVKRGGVNDLPIKNFTNP